MMLRRRIAPIACALMMSLGPIAAAEDARADQAADQAAKAFDQGRKLWDAKDPAGALPFFQKAAEQTNSPNARLYLARCLRDTGKLPQAYDEMERTVRDARELAEKDQRYVQTRDTAAAELALLEPRIGKIIVALGSTLSGAAVSIAGAAVDAAKLGTPIAVMPGNLSVVAKSADGTTTEKAVAVAAGATLTVTLERAATGAAPVSPTVPDKGPAPPPPEEEGGGFGVVRGVGIGVAAAGVAGFVLFAVGTLQADEKLSTLEQECGGGPCTDPKYEDVIQSGKNAEIMAYTGLGVGIAGVVAGTFMMIFGGPSEPEAKAARWEPTPNGVRLRF